MVCYTEELAIERCQAGRVQGSSALPQHASSHDDATTVCFGLIVGSNRDEPQ